MSLILPKPSLHCMSLILLPACLSCTNNSQKTMGAKVSRRTNTEDVVLSTSTTINSIFFHHGLNPIYTEPQSKPSIPELQPTGESSNARMRNQVTKFGAINKDRVDSSSRNVYVMDQKPSLSAELSMSMSRRFNKRAVLCGVTYEKRKFRLKGTVNDVRNMKIMLTDIFGCSNENIRVLTEQESDLRPTKKNILESLKWLVRDCQKGDSLVFYFSRHGLQQPDFKEDEIDGFDETICPVDFLREGMIVDNDINSIIVQPLKEGVTLHAIVDASHSGTSPDLTYVYNLDKCTWDDNKPPAKEPIRKQASGGLAICLGACGDSQTATDTTAFGGKGMNGVMTFLLTKIVRENHEITYGKLLEKMHDEIEKVIQSRCKPSFLTHIFPQKIAQVPILSSSAKFNVYERRFVL